ncbi:hypothetical protein CEXT_814291 [Caerostris extrusa]|uniref:Uncharacterized protein n=1 Tax=Caerostris extrusa TaxID=172846 RepID=A0AAV4QTP9_CAEEX|nr:hypothetical protein CEXT_814291 [Caerostris extrusa]
MGFRIGKKSFALERLFHAESAEGGSFVYGWSFSLHAQLTPASFLLVQQPIEASRAVYRYSARSSGCQPHAQPRFQSHALGSAACGIESTFMPYREYSACPLYCATAVSPDHDNDAASEAPLGTLTLFLIRTQLYLERILAQIISAFSLSETKQR